MAHEENDTDNSEISTHHTLGFNRHQALPGDSLSGFSITGPRPVDPFLRQVLSALILLGAKDGTN